MAIAEGGRGGEVRYLGELPTTEAATRKLVAKLAAKYHRLSFCYEAGPTGYGLYRLITSLDHECLGAIEVPRQHDFGGVRIRRLAATGPTQPSSPACSWCPLIYWPANKRNGPPPPSLTCTQCPSCCRVLKAQLRRNCATPGTPSIDAASLASVI